RAAVAGEEAGLLDHGAERRLVAGQRLSDAVLDRAGLARKPAADDGRDHVIGSAAIGNVERLGDDQAEGRTGGIGLLLAPVDLDPARAGLQPYARDGVLAAPGRISAAVLVELLLAQRSRFDRRGRRRSGRLFRRSLGGGGGLDLGFGGRGRSFRGLLGQ